MTTAPPLPATPLTVAAVLRSPRLLTREALAGIVTTLALVPEVISFSIVAGVDPLVSLVASIVLCLVMSVLGGRPGVVTAAAGSVALVIGPLVTAHGVKYVLPAVLLAGIVQLVFGLAGLARLMRFIPRSVMVGFVNALGVLIFTAQVRHVIGVPWIAYVLFALTLAVVLLLPRLTRAVPAPLIAIVLVTAIVIVAHVNVPNVGDEGPLAGGLPELTRFAVPLDLTTLSIIWPTAISVAFVGLMETLLTAKLVDDLTETPSRKGRESWALGVANIAAGFYGGIAGCAMIGQTILNVKTGGARTRVSTFVAGAFLLALVTGLSGVMARIPMVALAAVMMIVAITTVDWHSVRPSTLRRMPLPETIVMAVTVIVVVVSNNLALGVLVGVVLAMVLFARRIAHVIDVTRQVAGAGDSLRYIVTGPLFFGSSNDLVERFSYVEDAAEGRPITIDLERAQIWDASTVAALDSIESKYRALGVDVEIVGLDERSTAFHRRLSGRLSA
jgi:SulP family sulfate permease